MTGGSGMSCGSKWTWVTGKKMPAKSRGTSPWGSELRGRWVLMGREGGALLQSSCL